MAIPAGSRRRDYSTNPKPDPVSGPKTVEPHSPWQLLVEGKRSEMSLTLRELASRAQVAQGSLFNWVRAPSGGPSRRIYTANVNLRFANALKLEPEDLAEAYNNSVNKPLDPEAFEPEPAPRAPGFQESSTAFTVDGLKSFLAMAKASGKTTFTYADLEQIAAFILPKGAE